MKFGSASAATGPLQGSKIWGGNCKNVKVAVAQDGLIPLWNFLRPSSVRQLVS